MAGNLRDVVRPLCATLIFAITIGLNADSGAAPQQGIALPYEDRAEIDDLLSRYSYYIDSRAGEAFPGRCRQRARPAGDFRFAAG